MLFCRPFVSLSFLAEGGICADDSGGTTILYDAARQLAESMDIKLVEFRHHDVSPLLLPYLGNKVSVRLPLNTNSPDEWKKLNAKVRNPVRKVTKSGLTVQHREGADCLSAFYEVFAENMRDLVSSP